MSVTDNTNNVSATPASVEQVHLLFSQLEPQHVEAFYQHYHHWQQQQHAAVLQEQIAVVEQHIVNNNILMQNAQPSPIALATLTRLQSYGVDDVDLLDAMLERGDTWLDHTLQQLEQCERLDLIHDNYTEWCKLALEGAYDWLDSISETEATAVTQQSHEADITEQVVDDATESLLLEKLMSEDETVKIERNRQPVIVIPSRLSYAMKERKAEALSVENAQQPRLAIPSLLSYAMENTTTPIAIEEPTQQPEEQTPSPPVSTDTQQKSPKHGLVSRIMAKVWQT